MLYGEIFKLKKFLIPKKIHDAFNEDQNDMFISSHSQKYIFLIEFCADDEVCIYMHKEFLSYYFKFFNENFKQENSHIYVRVFNVVVNVLMKACSFR